MGNHSKEIPLFSAVFEAFEYFFHQIVCCYTELFYSLLLLLQLIACLQGKYAG
jgi:hypothetical protein